LPSERIADESLVPAGVKAAPQFVLEAKRWNPDSPRHVEHTQATERNTAPPSARTSRILIVDDNADMRDYIAGILRPHYTLDLASDGQEALDVARRTRPSLILSDVMMPNLDGFGLTRAIRSDLSLRDVPVVLLSARAGEEATVEGLEGGADDYLVKPFAARELLARVRTHVELSRQRAILERFFTLSLDLVCIANVDGFFERVSPAFSVLGHEMSEIQKRPFIEFVHPDDRAATRAEMESLARGNRTLHFENRFLCRDGSFRWLAWTAAPEGRTIYAIARDVTEAKRTQEALARAKDVAEAANHELEAFSYSVAHDLRAPLRGIDGFSQALLEDYADELDDEGKKYLSFVRESAQHMAVLIDDLLTLSRVTRSEMRDEMVDLSEIARTSLARLQRNDPQRVVKVTIEADLVDRGDPGLLTALFENLVGNAWKFTAKKDAPHIEFGRTVDHGRDAYFVRDNGAGFDMEFSAKLFGVFQRLHSAAEFEGTGIGLATVQRIVRRHHGRVWADSVVGVGACFYFTLHDDEEDAA
jgi:PAS domain S-box-containing protein